MDLICRNLQFLHRQAQEATSERMSRYGLFVPDVAEHESKPESCTDEILGRYCAFYNTTGFVMTVWEFLDPEYLRDHDLSADWDFHQKNSAYGNRPMKRKRR